MMMMMMMMMMRRQTLGKGEPSRNPHKEPQTPTNFAVSERNRNYVACEVDQKREPRSESWREAGAIGGA
jgi:hypothetical protein